LCVGFYLLLIHLVIPLLLEVGIWELKGLKVLLKDKNLNVNELGNIYFFVSGYQSRLYDLPE